MQHQNLRCIRFSCLTVMMIIIFNNKSYQPVRLLSCGVKGKLDVNGFWKKKREKKTYHSLEERGEKRGKYCIKQNTGEPNSYAVVSGIHKNRHFQDLELFVMVIFYKLKKLNMIGLKIRQGEDWKLQWREHFNWITIHCNQLWIVTNIHSSIQSQWDGFWHQELEFGLILNAYCNWTLC